MKSVSISASGLLPDVHVSVAQQTKGARKANPGYEGAIQAFGDAVSARATAEVGDKAKDTTMVSVSGSMYVSVTVTEKKVAAATEPDDDA